MLANCFQPEQTDYADADRLKQQFMISLHVRSSSVIYSLLWSFEESLLCRSHQGYLEQGVRL